MENTILTYEEARLMGLEYREFEVGNYHHKEEGGKYFFKKMIVRDLFNYMMGKSTDITPERVAFLCNPKMYSTNDINTISYLMREEQRRKIDGIKLIDVCGTGGDSANFPTLNISTTLAIVLASICDDTGYKVAKHGGKASTSLSGSMDVISALGIKYTTNIEDAENEIKKYGITFMYAPSFYPQFVKVAEIRKKINAPTIFNLLGPLLNPFKLDRQLIGIYDNSRIKEYRPIYSHPNTTTTKIVSTADGHDEALPFREVWVSRGFGKVKYIMPNDYGLYSNEKESIRGKDAEYNAMRMRDLFENPKSKENDCYFKAIVLNGCLALGGGLSPECKNRKLIENAMIEGKALAKLNELCGKVKTS